MAECGREGAEEGNGVGADVLFSPGSRVDLLCHLFVFIVTDLLTDFVEDFPEEFSDLSTRGGSCQVKSIEQWFPACPLTLHFIHLTFCIFVLYYGLFEMTVVNCFCFFF